MKTFKQLIQEVSAEYWNSDRLYDDPVAKDRVLHQADRLAKIAIANAKDPNIFRRTERAKRIAAIGGAKGLRTRATPEGTVELARVAPNLFGNPNEKITVSGGDPFEPGKIDISDFVRAKGLPDPITSASRANVLRKMAKIGRASNPEPMKESVSWHDAIRDNAFNLSDKDHKTAMTLLKNAYRTARSPRMYIDTLDAIHRHLTDSGVDSNHPSLRELASISTDQEEMYWAQERKKRIGN